MCIRDSGKVLDPVADRVLVLTAVITIMIHGAVPIWFGVATLAREMVVSVAVLWLASLGAARIDVLWVGKAGTFALMTPYPLFLVSHSTATDPTTSRARVATPNQIGTAPWSMIVITAVSTRTRSATGSSTLPIVETWWKRRDT